MSVRVHASSLIVFGLLLSLITAYAGAQSPDQTAQPKTETVKDNEGGDVSAPGNVGIQPHASDSEIAQRLVEILRLTNWFDDISVDVQQSVVFLTGVAEREEHRKWAGDLASKTQDVVAVVNRISLDKQPLWDFTSVGAEFSTLGRQTVRSLPQIAITIVIIGVTWMMSGRLAAWSRHVFKRRLGSELLASHAGWPLRASSQFCCVQEPHQELVCKSQNANTV